MSLRVFHVIFIAFSVLLLWGFGLWCLMSAQAPSGIKGVVAGLVSILLGVGLVVYEVRFLQKTKNLDAP